MRFIEKIKQKKFAMIFIFMFLYIALNLLDGERGLISYYEKQRIIEQLFQEKKLLVHELNLIENPYDLNQDLYL